MNTSSKSNFRLPTISETVSNKTERQDTPCIKNKKSKICADCSSAIPKRYIFTFLGCLATSLAWALSTNLNFAIVYMVDRTNTTVTRVQPSNECLANVISNESEGHQKEPAPKGEFYWSPEIEGLAIAAVYYGQMIGYLPGGRLAEVYGGKKVLIITFLIAAILTCLQPVTARYSVYFLIACRFLIGAIRAAILPTFYALISSWIPCTERNLTASILYAGYGTGGFLTFAVGGALCSSNFLGGWPSIFYTFGVLCAIWCLLCYIFLHDTPNDHPTITPNELDYISSNMGNTKRKKIKHVQWKSMALSAPLWSLLFAYFGQGWIVSISAVSQPLYMGTILNLNSIKNGGFSSIPQLLKVFLAIAFGYPLDWGVKRGYLSINFVRKGSTVINSLFCCVGIVGILFSGCDPTLNAIFFTIAAAASDFQIFGVGMICVDIAPNLSGTVKGIGSTIGVAPFFILPAFIGYMTKYERSMAQWYIIFYWSLGIIIITTLIFVIFGTADAQPWGVEDKVQSEDREATQTRL